MASIDTLPETSPQPREDDLDAETRGLIVQGARLNALFDRAVWNGREGVILLDDRGRVSAANPMARALLSTGTGLAISTTGLPRAADPQIHARLAQAIRKALSAPERAEPAVIDIVPIPGVTEGPPGLVSVVALPAGDPHQRGPGAVRAALLVRDPDSGFDALEAKLRALYALTPAEARVARAAAEGLDLDAISERTGASANTIKVQLRSVFRKMDVHKRSAFARVCQVLLAAGEGSVSAVSED